MYTIKYLKENSNLPGARVNLQLLYSFSKSVTDTEIMDCLNHIKSETENSPEEFIGMCGIVGYAVKNKNNNKLVIETIRKYASNF